MSEGSKPVVTKIWPGPGGIIQVKVPLPFSLKWVNSYLLQDERGYTVVDPGLHTPEAVQAWQEALGAHGIAINSIHTIVLTHQHPDHYGLAGWFQEKTGGAPVYISEASYAYTQRLWGSDAGAAFAADLTELYAAHGMPQTMLDEIAPHLDSFIAKVSPQPKVTFLEAGQPFEMGGLAWHTIDTPGHAKGQLCFYASEEKRMLCGDQVLPDITPNISVVPGDGEDQLQLFLDSLAQLRSYEVELAFPGHRDPFDNYQERIDQLISHHERRLAHMYSLIQSGADTGYTLCMQSFGERIAGNTHNLRFAMSETLAHLFHLEKSGRIVRSMQDAKVYFTIQAAE
ncbi:glyoxylase-like metal-dependent hydrolase (beta-lactamase superfamily II) [Paenibacillus taihuensis]|uniref:Glyoxylase-like metal-dependent hydrolase (Beta-lactamase superfamily II) n=1 Tax=Paenibacillus taihuensis TaxID=1156355 RepID=A0A3D9RRX6_9BACL|nr:MBL fold metallo-hydrolase [Paenibacillus taihuensis]REE82709.1 glyoxylase-like metal-dependent hydrolase (beta-lactamase superfamily II) [Paenibacillus taihuensis]